MMWYQKLSHLWTLYMHQRLKIGHHPCLFIWHNLIIINLTLTQAKNCFWTSSLGIHRLSSRFLFRAALFSMLIRFIVRSTVVYSIARSRKMKENKNSKRTSLAYFFYIKSKIKKNFYKKIPGKKKKRRRTRRKNVGGARLSCLPFFHSSFALLNAEQNPRESRSSINSHVFNQLPCFFTHGSFFSHRPFGLLSTFFISPSIHARHTINSIQQTKHNFIKYSSA